MGWVLPWTGAGGRLEGNVRGFEPGEMAIREGYTRNLDVLDMAAI